MSARNYILRCYDSDIDRKIIDLMENVPKGKRCEFLRKAILSYENNEVIIVTLTQIINNIEGLKNQIDKLSEKLDSVSISTHCEEVESLEKTNSEENSSDKNNEDKETEMKRQAFINSMVSFGQDF